MCVGGGGAVGVGIIRQGALCVCVGGGSGLS